MNLGRFISLVRLPPFAMRGESVQMNADLTLLQGDGNISVATKVWLALPFRTDPDRKQAAA